MTDIRETSRHPHGSPTSLTPDGLVPAGDAVSALCPYLLADGGGWRGTYPTRDHRCTAIEPPVVLALAKQQDLCLRPAHASCATFRAAADLEATAAEPLRTGDAGLWPTTSGPLVVLAPARGNASQLPGARARGQAMLIGLMVLAFAALVLTRPASPQAGTGASAAPGGQVTPPGPEMSAPGASVDAGVSPSAPPTGAPTGQPPTATASPVGTPGPSAPPSAPLTSYTVKRGDTLSSIAAANGTTVKKLKKANDLTSNLIRVGQVLVIP